MNRKLIAIPAIALAAGISLSACGTTVVQPPAQSAPKVNINNNNNAAPAPTTPAPVVVVPAAGEYSNSQTLYAALANEQQSELTAAPSYDYYSPGNISVTVTEAKRPGSGLYGGSGSRLSPVWARNPSMRAGRYWMRLSRFLMMAASWSGVLHEPRLPRLLFMFAQAPSTGLRSGA